MMHPSGRPAVVAPTWPNAGVEAWYRGQLDALVREMYIDSRAMIIPAVDETPPIIASDALPVAAGVMFCCGDRFLLLERNDGSGWALPGGHIEGGERPEEAARRETREETGVDFTGRLHFERVQESVWKDAPMHFAIFIARVRKQFIPRLNHEHRAHVWATLPEALAMPLLPAMRETLCMPPPARGAVLATDASPTKALQRAMQRWGDKWIKRFDLMSQRISLDFAAKNQHATQISMMAQLKKAGFTVAFKPTRASTEAYKAVAAEQVGLIKSIAQKYHTDVQSQVWESVKRGADLATLSKKLEANYGVTSRRAALIARDQNAKAKAVMEAVRHQQLGIKQALWMHSHAGKEPRPTHVKMNNKLYNLDQGMWDADEQEWVHPGQLINCRCTMRPYIPGFG